MADNEIVGCTCGRLRNTAPGHARSCPVFKHWAASGVSAAARAAADAYEDGRASGEHLVCTCGKAVSGPASFHRVGCPVYEAWASGAAEPILGLAPLRQEGRVIYSGDESNCPRCGIPNGHMHLDSCPLLKGPSFKVGDLVRTRDGRGARVVCVDARHPLPVVALVPVSESVPHGPLTGEWAAQYRADGRRSLEMETPEDLLPAPRRAVVWVGAFNGAFDFRPVGLRPDPCVFHAYLESERGMAIVDGVKALVRVELEEGVFEDE